MAQRTSVDEPSQLTTGQGLRPWAQDATYRFPSSLIPTSIPLPISPAASASSHRLAAAREVLGWMIPWGRPGHSGSERALCQRRLCATPGRRRFLGHLYRVYRLCRLCRVYRLCWTASRSISPWAGLGRGRISGEDVGREGEDVGGGYRGRGGDEQGRGAGVPSL
ncbi:hypothetical protein B2J93_8185 [Marssonina coronariae]|uniref:Uncharacterized protein n=1 Tax=Diplocarpon coronariae TaxID=2795749 RepID=A0A218YV88_9HELO|nr:hypothetical protein B2J93_8185 [Marssonina coronariae]